MMERAVVSQTRAALAMLRATIEACPLSVWNRENDRNRFWAVAYHTVFYAHLYLSPTEEEFAPFERAADGRAGFGRTDLGDWSQLDADDVYAKADVLAYCDHVDGRVANLVASTPFGAPSGFHWLPFTKGEAHLYNLRHIQHHAGQLADRLRRDADLGTKWAFAGP